MLSCNNCCCAGALHRLSGTLRRVVRLLAHFRNVHSKLNYASPPHTRVYLVTKADATLWRKRGEQQWAHALLLRPTKAIEVWHSSISLSKLSQIQSTLQFTRMLVNTYIYSRYWYVHVHYSHAFFTPSLSELPLRYAFKSNRKLRL